MGKSPPRRRAAVALRPCPLPVRPKTKSLPTYYNKSFPVRPSLCETSKVSAWPMVCTLGRRPCTPSDPGMPEGGGTTTAGLAGVYTITRLKTIPFPSGRGGDRQVGGEGKHCRSQCLRQRAGRLMMRLNKIKIRVLCVICGRISQRPNARYSFSCSIPS